MFAIKMRPWSQRRAAARICSASGMIAIVCCGIIISLSMAVTATTGRIEEGPPKLLSKYSIVGSKMFSGDNSVVGGRAFKIVQPCPAVSSCALLGGACLSCTFPNDCTYGLESTANCTVLADIACVGERNFSRQFVCMYCYQLPADSTRCIPRFDCDVRRANGQYYETNCTADPTPICMGRRTFRKNVRCNWTSGKKWSTALALSITLGGFGVDRMYLGYYGWGVFKLLSFGGLGVWTLVDAILIGTGYLTPADGSVYIF